MDRTIIANKIRTLRRHRGLSQEQLANISGVALRTIQRIEAEKVNAHPQTFQLLAKALGLSYEDLAGAEETLSHGKRADRNWITLLHIAAIPGYLIPFGNFLCPFMLWILMKNEFPELEPHGRAVLNFQLTMLIFSLPAMLMLLGLFPFPIVGFLIMVFCVPYSLIMSGINGWKVSQGKSFRYPLSIRFLRIRNIDVKNHI